MSINDRVKEVFSRSGLTQKNFSDKIDISPSQLSSILSGRDSVGLKIVEKILTAFPDVPPRWLIFGEIDLKEGTETASSTPGAIPFYMGVDVVAGQLPGDVDYSGEIKHYLVPGFEKCDFLVPVRGRSMQPLFLSGDIIGCRWVEHGKFIQWGHAYVVNTKNGVVLKRIHPGKSEEFVLAVSINSDEYPPFEISKNDILRMAIVVGVVRLN